MVYQGLTPPESSVPGSDSQHPHELMSEGSSDHDSLRLIGTTRFPPLDEVKTIFITGGAGFMSVSIVVPMDPHQRQLIDFYPQRQLGDSASDSPLSRVQDHLLR